MVSPQLAMECFARCSSLAVQLAILKVHLRCKQWRDGLAVFSGSCQEKLLEQFSDALLRATNECKAATPDWDICFESGSLNVLLAQKTLLNKMKGLVDGHNRLHAEISVHSVAVAYKCVLGSIVKACFLSQVCFSCS